MDKHNRKWAENVCDKGNCGKLLCTVSSFCFSEKSSLTMGIATHCKMSRGGGHRVHIGSRLEIGGVYLPSQLERTSTTLLVMVDRVKRGGG